MADVQMAAWRDASWFARPGRARRYHAVVDGLAACNRNDTAMSGDAMPLILPGEPASDVPQTLRCRRRACAQRFRDVAA